MIHKKQKQLAIFLFTFLLVNAFYLKMSLSSTEDTNSKSPFDLIYNEKGNMFSKQKVNDEFLNHNKLKPAQTISLNILKYNVGKNNIVSIDTNKEARFKNLTIRAEHCLYEKDNILNPMNMAYIKISNSNRELVFKGWLFSKLSALSLPNYDGYFFFLRNCS